MAVTKKMCVLLVIGGDSCERDVSIDTGKAVFEALRGMGHRVYVADPLRSEIKPTEDPRVFFADASITQEPPRFDDERFTARRRFIDVLGQHNNLSCDVVFNGLHGGAGEDGTIQAVLDFLGVRYTGSGACACAVAMNKDLSKRLAAGAGVPVAKHILVDSTTHESVVADQQISEHISFPVVVKPNCEGSSVGVTIAEDRDALEGAIDKAKVLGGAFLVESYVPGREITAAILDYNSLPLLEIRPREGFFDYENKYQPGSCEYLVPAPLDGAVARAVGQSAIAAYRAFGCRGYARVDFRVNDRGEHFFLEANTLPGLTANSLVPKAARAAGIEFPELIGAILRLATAPSPL
ncbi:MAG: D-alanine--D-alanine ligase [Candidatus Krumholzibacteriia bacterium]